MLVFASVGGLLTEIKKNDRLCGGGDGPLGSVQERCYLTSPLDSPRLSLSLDRAFVR